MILKINNNFLKYIKMYKKYKKIKVNDGILGILLVKQNAKIIIFPSEINNCKVPEIIGTYLIKINDINVTNMDILEISKLLLSTNDRILTISNNKIIPIAKSI